MYQGGNSDVSICTQRGVGRITLTRPSALHALNQDMCAHILAALEAWREDERIGAVWIDHQEGTRGFCAGGDIRMLAESGAGDACEARDFFRTEYRMNAALKSFPRPVVAVMDGITMGGGVGLSVHGMFRIATERTVFSMPETGIGLFPDVGGGWFLPRLEGETGTWLALTGARLKGYDVAGIGIATHHVPSQRLAGLASEVFAAVEAGAGAREIGQLLDGHKEGGAPPEHLAWLEGINRCFCADSAEAILAALDAEPSEWLRQQAAIIRTRSPETVKVTLRQLREGRAARSFEENMRMEFRIGWRKVSSPDFLEGVRAVIIDKDNQPVWSPARFEDVSEADVARYFEPLGDEDLTF